MSTPPPVPPEMPETPRDSEGISLQPPAPPPIPDEVVTPSPPLLPPHLSGPPAAPYHHVTPPPKSPGSSTRGLLYGCLGLLAAGGIIAVIGGMWAFKKAKGFVENPEQFIAEMAVKANPDLELVSVDKTARQVIIKDKTSGESTTFTFDEVKDGKIGLKKSDGSRAEVGPDGIRVKAKDGTESVIGGGSNVPLPAWVPAYVGEHKMIMSSQKTKGNNQSGKFAFLTPDPLKTAAGSYQQALETGGFKVIPATTAAGGTGVVTLEATAMLEGGGTEQINVQIFAEGTETMVQLEYSHQEASPDEPIER